MTVLCAAISAGFDRFDVETKAGCLRIGADFAGVLLRCVGLWESQSAALIVCAKALG